MKDIKLVISISPMDGKNGLHRAVCEWNGKQFAALGSSNIHALSNLFDELTNWLPN